MNRDESEDVMNECERLQVMQSKFADGMFSFFLPYLPGSLSVQANVLYIISD